MRRYRIQKGHAFYVAAFSFVWVGMLVAAASVSLPESLLFHLIALLPLGYLWVFYEVSLSDDGTCEFRSVIRRRRLRVQQFTAISADEEAIYVHHDRGKIHMWELADFADFLTRVTELNPAIELRGWVRDEVSGSAQPEAAARQSRME